jgi:ABC-type phosphate transport system substrate-binding protein
VLDVLVSLCRIPVLIACFLASLSQTAFADAVIVNDSVTIETLSQHELRSIFAMRSVRWPDGSPIRVFVLPDQSDLHKSFVKSELDMFPYQLRMSWDRAVFSGTGAPPRKVSSIEDMVTRIRSTKGGIGYINDESIPLAEGVKIVHVD